MYHKGLIEHNKLYGRHKAMNSYYEPMSITIALSLAYNSNKSHGYLYEIASHEVTFDIQISCICLLKLNFKISI